MKVEVGKKNRDFMISKHIDNDRIEGLEKLFDVFPRDFSFGGAFLKGVLLHANGEVQLTYCIMSEKTYNFVFIMSILLCHLDLIFQCFL